MTRPIIIVGAGLSALRTAEAIARTGSDHPIVVIGEEPWLPYDRPPLSKDALMKGIDHAELAYPLRSAVQRVMWQPGTRVVSADLERRTVVDDAGHAHDYAALVVATGVRARTLGLETGTASVHRLRSLDDAARLRPQLRAASHVVIAGAGFVGCEVAATARQLGSKVTMVFPERVPLEISVGQALGADIGCRHQRRGVRLLAGRHIVSMDTALGSTSVTLDDGSALSCDVVVEAVGSVPTTDWLIGNDLDLGRGVHTDTALRALRADGHPWKDVFVVGDAARFPHPIFDGEPRPIEHWNLATDTGRRAGRMIALTLQGRAAEPELEDAAAEQFAPMPSFWSDQYEMHLLAYGVPALADEARLLEGVPGADCVHGYYRRGALVGVCGIGYRSVFQDYRRELSAAWSPATAGAR